MLNVLKNQNAQRLSNVKRKKNAKKNVTKNAKRNVTKNVIKNKIAIKSKNAKKHVKNNYHFTNNEKGATMMLFPFLL